MIATLANHPLVHLGDIRLGAAFANGGLAEPRLGQKLGTCLLAETGDRLLQWNVFLGGVLVRGLETHVIGVCPGRTDLFLGTWWSSDEGPQLWRLGVVSLETAWPMEPLPRAWEGSSEIRARSEALVEGLREALAPAEAPPLDLTEGYRLAVASLLDAALAFATLHGRSKLGTHFAADIDPSWGLEQMVAPRRPGVVHAISTALALVPIWGQGGREEGIAILLVKLGWAMEHRCPAPTDETVRRILVDAARDLTTQEPGFAESGILANWRRIRELRGDPEWGIKKARTSLAYRRMEEGGARAAVRHQAPAGSGIVRRGGTADGRTR